MSFMHAFNAMHYIFKVITLVSVTNVISSKTQDIAVNECINGMVQLVIGKDIKMKFSETVTS